ncbi:MAG: M1 family peptidase, partial [Gemmatimonadales bacterium]
MPFRCDRIGTWSAALLLVAPVLAAQSTPPALQAIAGMVPASDVRTAAGRPGPRYWQQRADYAIDASLDPATDLMRGSETITYHNNSPDALPYLWMQVEQNICT